MGELGRMIMLIILLMITSEAGAGVWTCEQSKDRPLWPRLQLRGGYCDKSRRVMAKAEVAITGTLLSALLEHIGSLAAVPP